MEYIKGWRYYITREKISREKRSNPSFI